MPKNLIPAVIGALAGNWVFDNVISKPAVFGPGFIETEGGFGFDDIVRATTIVVVGAWARRMLPGL